jgi:hypothetical protein
MKIRDFFQQSVWHGNYEFIRGIGMQVKPKREMYVRGKPVKVIRPIGKGSRPGIGRQYKSHEDRYQVMTPDGGVFVVYGFEHIAEEK